MQIAIRNITHEQHRAGKLLAVGHSYSWRGRDWRASRISMTGNMLRHLLCDSFWSFMADPEGDTQQLITKALTRIWRHSRQRLRSCDSQVLEITDEACVSYSRNTRGLSEETGPCPSSGRGKQSVLQVQGSRISTCSKTRIITERWGRDLRGM